LRSLSDFAGPSVGLAATTTIQSQHCYRQAMNVSWSVRSEAGARRHLIVGCRLFGALAACCALALLSPAVASACAGGWQVQDLQSQLMCPTCHVPLDQSQSTEANRIRAFIDGRCKAGWSEQRVKSTLVAQFGEAILAAPPVSGFGALAWVVPGAVLLVGMTICAVLAFSWTKRRGRPVAPGEARATSATDLDPAVERQIDAELDDFD
jgi:cytochrome c-type biogenesis protein CcmH